MARIILLVTFLFALSWHLPVRAESTVSRDPVYEVCDWCISNQDFKIFTEAKVATKEPGAYEYFVGNPFSETLVRVLVTAHPNQQPFSLVTPAAENLTQDFQAVSKLARTESMIVIPPNACVHCGSYADSVNEPDFYAWIYSNHAESIISGLRSRSTPFVYLVKSFFFGKHATLVVVFPNGDSVKVDIISMVLTPGALAQQEGSAVDAEGVPLGAEGDTSHHGGGVGPGIFNLRIERPGGWSIHVTWYACGPDGEGGYSCEEIPPPNDDSITNN